TRPPVPHGTSGPTPGQLAWSAVPSDKRARQRAGRDARMAELRRSQHRRRNLRRGGIAAVIVAIFLGIGLYGSLGGSTKKPTKVSTRPTTTTLPTSATTAPAAGKPPTAAPVPGGTLTGATPCPPAGGAAKRITSFAQAPPNCLSPGKTYTATFTTNEGTVVVALDTTKTPKTANNFVVLSLYHYYDGTAMFRTDPSIGIIQGGAPKTQSNSGRGPGYTIADEGSGYTYAPGDLVMARTSAPNSAGAQYFFCVTSACSGLNSQGNYVVFGKTTSGLNVLQKILALNVNTSGGLGGAPSKLVIVKSVTITES
ncbi:MAG: peptidylprolyl isomerase, partial [Acidimicrobiales bacterium]